MHLNINNDGIAIRKTESDIKGSSWFDAIDDGTPTVILIRDGTSSHDLVKDMLTYKEAFSLSTRLNELWNDMTIDQIMFFDHGKVQILQEI